VRESARLSGRKWRTVTLTPAAKTRLQALLTRAPAGATGFAFAGAAGTCRGSVPRLRPAAGPGPGESVETCAGVLFFVPEAWQARFSEASLDYEPGLFGRGLTLRWPHQAGCRCEHESRP
jgi:Fe-S cluster assembly iron-binding protein IscA